MYKIIAALKSRKPSWGAALAKVVVKLASLLFARPKISGLPVVPKTGPGLLIANRTSAIDSVVLAAALDRPLAVFLDKSWPENAWLKVLGLWQRVERIDYDKPLGPQGVDRALDEGLLAVVFPEAIPATATIITKITQETAFLAYETGVPKFFAISEGLQYRRHGDGPTTLGQPPVAAPVRLFFHGGVELPPIGDAAGRERKVKMAKGLHHAMTELRFEDSAEFWQMNMWLALLRAKKVFGASKITLEDASRKPVSYRELVAMARRFASRFEAETSRGEAVGLLLPNTVNMAASIFGLLSIARVATMLNYTQGTVLFKASLETARVKTIVISSSFLRDSGLIKLIEGLDVNLIDVDKFPAPGFWDKVASHLPEFASPADLPGSEETAIIVFTSGSEGLPKGVVHSHQSLLSNNYQVVTQNGFDCDEIIFNAMPLFHTMGLNLLFLLPILLGMKCFLYLTPLHAHTIPRLIYESKATFMVASDTFANAWARETHITDLHNIKYLLAGSERIKPKTHELYFKEFGVRILEGYGVTETSPAIAINSWMNFRFSSVGLLMPGLKARLEPVEGVSAGGVLSLKGPNVMRGYILPDNPGQIVPPPDGWHDTGDIVEIDEDGFLYVRGRRKRFAKVAGEMISLATVEEVVNKLWPGRVQAVVSVEDDKRGERLVLVTEEPELDMVKLRQAIREEGLPDFYTPRQFVSMKIPLYPVGKINMPQLVLDVAEKLKEGAAPQA
jgi:acyl-[acyl-carrier-protein]-phospholipid O-acyltransferase/long-chain-fatty-acid--[acyl-carrier-protein] ligase